MLGFPKWDDIFKASDPGTAGDEMDEYELTIVMPCLNEARTVGICVQKAQEYLTRAGIGGEIIVADNGSTDGSTEIAHAGGARVVHVTEKGYGCALLGGITAARGKFVIMGDCDDSYDFSALSSFIEALRGGNQLVMGNRYKGGIKPGAMPFLHRYLGNPVLSFIGRVFFGSRCGDFQCGLRGFSRQAILELDLQTSGMEFSTEMVVKATIRRLKITEVPTTLSPDGRGRPPHLRTWRDGWRYLRFLLLFSPRWLFLFPGCLLFMIGLAGTVILSLEPLVAGRVTIGIHTLFYCAIAMIIGFQCILFWLFARMYIMREGIVPQDRLFKKIVATATLEIGLMTGALLVVIGLVLSLAALNYWRILQFGPLNADDTMRLVIPAGTIILIGTQFAFGSFFLSVLEFRTSRRVPAQTPNDSQEAE